MLDPSLKALAIVIYKNIIFLQKSGNVFVFGINLTSGGLIKHSRDFVTGFASESCVDSYPRRHGNHCLLHFITTT